MLSRERDVFLYRTLAGTATGAAIILLAYGAYLTFQRIPVEREIFKDFGAQLPTRHVSAGGAVAAGGRLTTGVIAGAIATAIRAGDSFAAASCSRVAAAFRDPALEWSFVNFAIIAASDRVA